LAGLISFGVAIADEIYQAYIPSRDASTIDIFLDLIGITLVLFLFQLYKKRKLSH
jgi:VanZ family protein